MGVTTFTPEIQDKFNAYNCWNNQFREEKGRDFGKTPDEVREQIKASRDALGAILDREHPDHDRMIEEGRQWSQDLERAIESKLVYEDRDMRVFITDSTPCSAGYYSPKQEICCPATIVLNTRFDSITLAFADGGKQFSAQEIMRETFGPDAGGRDGIAGSPRGTRMDEKDLTIITAGMHERFEIERSS